jgi:hypothetical protein
MFSGFGTGWIQGRPAEKDLPKTEFRRMWVSFSGFRCFT